MNEDGVLATYIVFYEAMLGQLPKYLSWEEAVLILCMGFIVSAVLRDVGIEKCVLIQGISVMWSAAVRE
jgi:NADPH:quinone reductase-like Zn-dependent oxidoreductase